MTSRYAISTLVQRRLKELNVTAEDVIRKALDIKAEGLATSEGAFFPEGAVFFAWYKDAAHVGRVRDGAIVMDSDPNTSYTSVSGAAAQVTGRATTNGWDFWGVKLPGKSDFVPIKNFRNRIN